MRLDRALFEKDGSGEVQLTPLEPEDMWHAYNLISGWCSLFRVARAGMQRDP